MGKIEPRYTTSVTVTGGRGGHAISDDGALDVQLRHPAADGRSDGTNPEQLFAAAWGACFQSALIAAAQESGIDASSSTVTVTVAQGPDSDGGYGLAARITVELPGVDRATAQRLADAAHAMCPYSRATRGNIAVTVEAS